MSAPAAPTEKPASAPGAKVRAAKLARGFHARLWPTARYLTTTEVHTFAFSVAANVILSFFPFILVLLTLIRFVFHSKTMNDVVINLLRDYLPAGQDFVIRNLNLLVNAHRGAQVAALLILLITSSGVFLPLEVALNRIWGFKKDRSYLGNQLISLALAFACGVLALISVALTAGQQSLLLNVIGNQAISQLVTFFVMKVLAVFATVTIFFLIYWLLPAGHVPARAVMPVAIFTGLLWELAKYAYMFALPWLNFEEVYGPFSLSVTLMFWAFLSGLLLLAGAHLSAGNDVD
ncbi:MAG: YihY/virulence factor BrkB family protein [Acidobacteriota bacterium]|nr:YihY/virulence factor BrkB family protein [Acidobacteriota bacterium]